MYLHLQQPSVRLSSKRIEAAKRGRRQNKQNNKTKVQYIRKVQVLAFSVALEWARLRRQYGSQTERRGAARRAASSPPYSRVKLCCEVMASHCAQRTSTRDKTIRMRIRTQYLLYWKFPWEKKRTRTCGWVLLWENEWETRNCSRELWKWEQNAIAKKRTVIKRVQLRPTRMKWNEKRREEKFTRIYYKCASRSWKDDKSIPANK